MNYSNETGISIFERCLHTIERHDALRQDSSGSEAIYHDAFGQDFAG